MKNLFYILTFCTILSPSLLQADQSFSVEIEALTLVMQKYNSEKNEEDISQQKPSYMAFRQDECNAKVEVTEKNGLQVTTMESFNVNVCKNEILKSTE